MKGLGVERRNLTDQTTLNGKLARRLETSLIERACQNNVSAVPNTRVRDVR